MVRMVLAAHLASLTLIEDCRAGLQGDQLKLVPTSPDHPSRKFRIIQLWGNNTRTDICGATSKIKTVLTPFVKRDERASNGRRWPARRKSPLKVDLLQEARKLEGEYQASLEEVRQYRARRPAWACGTDDGLDPKPGETIEGYIQKVKQLFHQKW